MGAPKKDGVKPRSLVEKAVGRPEDWLMPVGDPVLLSPLASTPKYAGSFPQSVGSTFPDRMAFPHCAGLEGPVTRSGTWNSKIACARPEFGDGPKDSTNFTPRLATAMGFCGLPIPPTAYAVKQAGPPAQVAVIWSVVATKLSLPSVFNSSCS